MSRTLATLAPLIDGVCVGNSDLPVESVVHPAQVSQETQLALILQPEALAVLSKTARIALLPVDLPFPGHTSLEGAIQVARPKLALAKLLTLFERIPHHQAGIHPSAVVEKNAQIHPTASIGALAYVGPDAIIGPNTVVLPHVTVGANAVIGESCLIHPGVRIGERVVLGNRVILHHNASIGADGFSFVTPEAGSIESAQRTGKIIAQNDRIQRIPSIGTVVLGDDVEVGACATIDRGNIDATVIGSGSKIDNLVMIGHNNTLGKNCLIAGQVGIAGSCEIGDRVVMAGQVGLADHLTIGDDAILMAQTGVNKSIPAKAMILGTPGVPWREAAEQFAGINKLKQLRQDVRMLKQQVAALQAATPNN